MEEEVEEKEDVDTIVEVDHKGEVNENDNGSDIELRTVAQNTLNRITYLEALQSQVDYVQASEPRSFQPEELELEETINFDTPFQSVQLKKSESKVLTV